MLLGTSKCIHCIQGSFTLPCIPFSFLSSPQFVDRGFVQIEVQIQKPTRKKRIPIFSIYITATLGLPLHKPIGIIFWSIKILNPLVIDTLVSVGTTTCILQFSLEKFCLTRSLASLFDSSKSSIHIRIIPFLPQEITIIDYSMLHQKQTLSTCIYLLGINTDPITYTIDTHQRWRSIPVLSHILRGRTQVPRTHLHTYTPRHLQNIQKILSLFTSNKIQEYYNKME